MTKERLEKELQALEQQKTQAVATLNALAGAEQVLKVLLAEMEAEPHAEDNQN